MSEFTDKFEKVGALWKTKSGNGWSGKIEKNLSKDTRILVFENKDKRQSNHPDMQLFIEREKPPVEEAMPTEPDEDCPF